MLISFHLHCQPVSLVLISEWSLAPELQSLAPSRIEIKTKFLSHNPIIQIIFVQVQFTHSFFFGL